MRNWIVYFTDAFGREVTAMYQAFHFHTVEDLFFCDFGVPYDYIEEAA